MLKAKNCLAKANRLCYCVLHMKHIFLLFLVLSGCSSDNQIIVGKCYTPGSASPFHNQYIFKYEGTKGTNEYWSLLYSNTRYLTNIENALKDLKYKDRITVDCPK